MGSRVSGQPVTARFWRDPCTLLIACIAGLGTAHILVRTATYGAGFGNGGQEFLSTAINFLAGEGWRDFKGWPLTGWPPLFPLLLAAGGWVGIEPQEAGRLINATAFGLTILAAGCWLRSNLRSQWLALATTALIAASLPLSYHASLLLAESLFALFTLLALLQLAAFLNRETAAPLWWAAVFTALTAITRWPGVALIGTSVLILRPLARPKHTLVFGAISSVPLLAVLTHNWAVTGDLTRATGNREPLGQPLSDGLRQTVEVFRTWIVPPNAPDGLAYLLGLAVATVVLASATVILRATRIRSNNDRKDPEAAPADHRLGPILPFGAFSVAYLVFLIVVVPFTVKQGVDSRYLLPIYVPLLLTAVFLLDRFLSIEAAGWMGAVRYGLAALVVLATLAHVGCSAHENLRLTAQVWRTGRTGYGINAYWRHSETLKYVRNNPIEGRIYSNYRQLVWFADRNRTATPKKHRLLSHKMMRWPEIEAGAHIVWLDRGYVRGFLGHDDLDLRVLPGMEIVAELADGLVLRRTAYEPFDAKRHHARKQRYVNQLIQQASEQVVRADWNVYRTGHKLIYRKAPCAPADVQGQFVLHVVPADPADLPPHRQQFDSDNRDFYFDRRGFWLNDQCIAIIPLPNYAIDRIHIGQWMAEEDRTVWEAKLPPVRLQQLIQQASEQVVRAGWNVYRTERKLIYRKEPCAPADVQAKFVLHVVPADPADLPPHRQQYDSDNLDFYFNQYGERFDDQCIAIAPLPDYAISRIYIGQWMDEEDRTLWEAEFPASR